MSSNSGPSSRLSPKESGSHDFPASSRIAVAIGGPTTDDALQAYDSVSGRAGIVELRIDLFSEPADLHRLITSRPCPVVVTCRASVEGGRFHGSESERLDILREAAALGADFIDVERFAFHELGPVAPTRVILSQHDFASMPANLSSLWAEIRSLGADVVKVAGMATEPADILPVLEVLAHADVPTIAMAMGPAGVASRVLALRYRCCVLTYASLDGDAGTAPGQLSLSEMHEVYHASSISPSTSVFGLVAPFVEAELVTTYNNLLRGEKVDAVCVPLPTSRPNSKLLQALFMEGFLGFHIHGPGQRALQTAAENGEIEADSSNGLNSVSVVQGQLRLGQVSSPAEQVSRWLAHLA
jgi:3-dehydroquinate dehydratase / shikimate dehydrogenase